MPYNGGTPQPGNRTGQTEGPAATRRQSHEQFEHEAGWYDIENDRDYLVGVARLSVSTWSN
ncbi:MAG: hypothetical protein KDB62_07205 [Solirubrobacterales bacterium]|nr:hypothetical protein [Solirubrobacterales bacterium]